MTSQRTSCSIDYSCRSLEMFLSAAKLMLPSMNISRPTQFYERRSPTNSVIVHKHLWRRNQSQSWM